MDVREYTANNKYPTSEWLETLDPVIKARIVNRIGRIRNGNFGDHKSVGDGVSELRFSFGSGYRVYYGKDGNTIVILLCGGDKSSQKIDIEKAKDYWRDYCA